MLGGSQGALCPAPSPSWAGGNPGPTWRLGDPGGTVVCGPHSLTAATVLTAPKLSVECRVDILFLLASSAAATPEGFQRAKTFVKRCAQAVLGEASRARVGVAHYSSKLAVAVPVGEYLDVPDLVRSLDGVPFGGGPTLTGRALQQVAERGFGSTAWTGQDQPRRVVVLMTEARSQDKVAVPALFARARELLLLGVGSEAVQAELEEITGSPERVMVYTGPQDLFNQIPKLRGHLCSQPRPGKDPYPCWYQLSASRFVAGSGSFWFLLNQGQCWGLDPQPNLFTYQPVQGVTSQLTNSSTSRGPLGSMKYDKQHPP